jgi:benzodiazapine receptor
MRPRSPELRVQPGAPPGQWRALLVVALAVIATGVAGGFASTDAREFYAQLARPAWAPPAQVFGPVWTLLYLIMGFAAWCVWRARGRFALARLPLTLFFVQLAVNALWSWLFFRWRLGGPALFDVALLWMLLVATVAAFWQVRRLAGLLMLPYLLWTAYATALTAAVWRLNPALL